MDWTVRYFLYQSGVWHNRISYAKELDDNGAAGYAAKKKAMWMDLAKNAVAQFKSVNPLYKSNF